MAKQFTLGKDERLKSRTSIDRIFRDGKKFTSTPFRIHYLFFPGSTTGSIAFGVGVSTKIFKNAVDRNRVKRLAREAWRLQKIQLQESLTAKSLHLDLFLIYHGNELPVYEDVYKAVGSIINKLQKLAV